MAPRPAPLPESIGRFRVEAVLGRGGMGEVYKAFDPTLQRTVAVKTVRPDINRPEYLERLYREAQACARLHHPHIVTVYEAGELDGVVYIAMEYLQGENLATIIERSLPGIDDAVRILVQVLEALHHAHELGVIHRDVKPSNVHRQPDGTIKLVDFGLARILQADTMTASGNVLGTPHYASPEQLRGETLDRRTDVYSTGVLAYEMLSGRRPFEPDNDSISSVIIKVISTPAPPINTDVSRLMPEIEHIVTRAMAKAPGDRYQTALEMRDALLAFRERSREALTMADNASAATVIVSEPGPAESVPVAAATRARSRAAWWVAGAAAAALALVAMIPRAPAAEEGAPPSLETPIAAADPAPAGADVLPAAPAGPPASAAVPPASAASAGSDAGAPAPVAARALSAKQLFVRAGGTPAAGLRYRLIHQSPDGGQADVDVDTTFHSGDRVKFAFESNIDGYLYVAQQGSSGAWTVLFPSPQINGGQNAVKRLEEYEVPQDGWFMFDATPGVEQVFVFLSREPLSHLPGFDRPVTRAEVLTASVVDDLQQSIRSRDLIFEKDRPAAGKAGVQATYVVNRADVGRAVTASFTLTHK